LSTMWSSSMILIFSIAELLCPAFRESLHSLDNVLSVGTSLNTGSYHSRAETPSHALSPFD